jgi:hypothetical protein
MTVARLTGLMLILGAIALVVVHLRVEQARTARRIQKIQMELVGIRRESWAAQLAIARLKAPQRLEKRVEELHLRVAAPYPPPGREGDDSVWVKAP